MDSENKEISNNLAFYSAIAVRYDVLLAKEGSNTETRKMVAERFNALAKNKDHVMDFGGGTGADLSWLSGICRKLIFCEPAAGMRELAIASAEQYNNIVFLNSEQSNAFSWQAALPFEQKLTAVLCNFAVLNCIRDLPAIFKSLALVTSQGADLFFLVLNSSRKKMFEISRAKAIANIFGVPFSYELSQDGLQQTVYLHSEKEIRKASKDFFSLKKIERWPANGFSFIQLEKK
jgi:ubiquinone/menaquinone biosynthesis C-methylase UbiE